MKRKLKKIITLKTNLFPFLTILVSIFITNLPLHFDSPNFLLPSLTFPIIYFWTNHKPSLVGAPAIMILGIVKDILEHSLLGLNSLFFLVFQTIIFSQKKILIKSNNFMLIWAEYIFCLGLIFLLPYVLTFMQINVIILPFSILFLKWLISCFAYIPIHWMMHLLSKIIR